MTIDLGPLRKQSVEDLRRLQLERLGESLARASSVEFYRERFAESGAGHLSSLDDLKQFPFTLKTDLRDTYPFGMFAVPRESVRRIHASSGTTGKPTIVGYTESDLDHWSDLMARSITAAGGKPGDMVHVSYGYGLFTGGLGAHYGAERLGCTVIPMSGGQTAKQVQMIADLDPDIIMVTPSYLLNLADEMETQSVDPSKLRLRLAILGAEPWTDAMRDEIESRLHVKAMNIYGLSEVMGPGVAQECAGDEEGLTLWEDHFYPEIIDPESGEVLPDGEWGELVLTSLTKEALPVIRYRTRDITRLLPATQFAMRRMDRIRGRSDDMLIIRGVNVYPSQVEEHILAVEGLSPHYQLVVDRKDNLDQLSLLVETSESSRSNSGLAHSLANRIKTYMGVSVRVILCDFQEVERSQGKAQRIVDRR